MRATAKFIREIILGWGCMGLIVLPPAFALQPGDVVTAANVDTVADQLSPGLQWCVEHGMQMTIVPYQRVEVPKAYATASEQFAGQVKLLDGGRRLEGYVAGLPFPKIDPADPDAAVKIMWNFSYRPWYTDDYAWKNARVETGNITPTGFHVERGYTLRESGRLYYNGRLFVDPKPELPNPDRIRFKEILGPFLEPLDLKGIGSLTYRFLNEEEQDRTWLYMPALRRVRRLSSAQRSDAIFGQDTDLDSYYGYSGNIAWFKWRFLGEKTMLANFHTQHSLTQWCPGNGEFAFCDNWEPRQLYVVEGIPATPQYAYSKRLIYIDKETFQCTYMDAYDPAGRLWRMWIQNIRMTKRLSNHPTAVVYPEEQAFGPAFMMVDVQLSHATRGWAPTQASVTGEEEFLNVGGERAGIPESFYEVSHLIAVGR